MSDNAYQDGTSSSQLSKDIDINTEPFRLFADGEYDELSDGEGLSIGVDVEGVVVEIVPPFVESTDRFFQQNHPDYHQEELDGEFTVEDTGGWGQPGTMEHLAEARGWKDYNVVDVLFGEDEQYSEANSGEWKGFMYIVDNHWNNQWPFADEQGNGDIINPVEVVSSDALSRIKDSPIVDNVYFVTGRNDGLDEETEGVEDSVRDWLGRHGYLDEVDGLFHTESKTQLMVDGEPVHVFPDDNPGMMAERKADEIFPGQAQVLINYEGNLMTDNPEQYAVEEHDAMEEYLAGSAENLAGFAEAMQKPEYQRALAETLASN